MFANSSTTPEKKMQIRHSMLAAYVAAASLAGASAQAAPAPVIAKASVQENAALMAALRAPHASEGLDADHGYVLAREHPGPAGTRVARLHHTYKGVRVLGSDSVRAAPTRARSTSIPSSMRARPSTAWCAPTRRWDCSATRPARNW